MHTMEHTNIRPRANEPLRQRGPHTHKLRCRYYMPPNRGHGPFYVRKYVVYVHTLVYHI